MVGKSDPGPGMSMRETAPGAVLWSSSVEDESSVRQARRSEIKSLQGTPDHTAVTLSSLHSFPK